MVRDHLTSFGQRILELQSNEIVVLNEEDAPRVGRVGTCGPKHDCTPADQSKELDWTNKPRVHMRFLVQYARNAAECRHDASRKCHGAGKQAQLAPSYNAARHLIRTSPYRAIGNISVSNTALTAHLGNMVLLLPRLSRSCAWEAP